MDLKLVILAFAVMNAMLMVSKRNANCYLIVDLRFLPDPENMVMPFG